MTPVLELTELLEIVIEMSGALWSIYKETKRWVLLRIVNWNSATGLFPIVMFMLRLKSPTIETGESNRILRVRLLKLIEYFTRDIEREEILAQAELFRAYPAAHEMQLVVELQVAHS